MGLISSFLLDLASTRAVYWNPFVNWPAIRCMKTMKSICWWRFWILWWREFLKDRMNLDDWESCAFSGRRNTKDSLRQRIMSGRNTKWLSISVSLVAIVELFMLNVRTPFWIEWPICRMISTALMRRRVLFKLSNKVIKNKLNVFSFLNIASDFEMLSKTTFSLSSSPAPSTKEHKSADEKW